MFHEMRIAALVQKPLHGPSAMDARTVLTLATRGGASALEIASETGSIEEGKKADLLLLDMGRLWNPVHATGDQNIYSSIVYTGSPANVQDVVVDGRWLVREGEMLTLNEREISRSARRELSALLERAHL
jgi:cytosine/adenosine deaminase-related metal-dependent hydrolase